MTGRTTVLIVEDDVDLAEVTCEVLEEVGVPAVYRTTLDDALEYLARNSATTAAVLTDVNLMSPMGGIELSVYVAEEWPDVAICVTSGLSLERPNRLPVKATFMAKPWRPEELIQFARAASQR